MKQLNLVVLSAFWVVSIQGQKVAVSTIEDASFASACSLNINNQLPQPQPLFLIPDTEQFRYPASNDRILSLNAGETIELACENGFNLFPEKHSIIVSCVLNQFFNHDSRMYQFSELSCTNNWFSKARRTNVSCEIGASIVELGFDMGNDRFPKIMDICHNENTFENHWIKHEFHRAHAGYQQGVARPNWYQGDFYPGVNVNTLYTVVRQRETIADILESQELADHLVRDVNSGVYMARGHIASRTDFVYATHQNATFWFLVVAPQWQNFNEGNWLRVEESARNFVARRNIRVTVYGGTYFVNSQVNAEGEERDIYLDWESGRSSNRLPVPGLYYKILHDEHHKSGIALIGVNDIHRSLERIQELILCDDIADKISWINWDRSNLGRGYVYACEVNDFLSKIGHLQDLYVPNLLI
ncbi:uncharacterized protein LOC129749206 [Uranotaenia lowii]|uniref:uncharacterized protein LOC129749206 n=1 Tax=Uranotaenia lowii TaxID=190385 RepID=UPI00247AF2B5|nr:uncharacterized protein LOC129749206 [Uranotaenia lowii]